MRGRAGARKKERQTRYSIRRYLLDTNNRKTAKVGVNIEAERKTRKIYRIRIVVPAERKIKSTIPGFRGDLLKNN
jgi:hypothetical protein